MTIEEKSLIGIFAIVSIVLLIGFINPQGSEYQTNMGVSSFLMAMMTYFLYEGFSMLSDWRKKSDYDVDPGA